MLIPTIRFFPAAERLARQRLRRHLKHMPVMVFMSDMLYAVVYYPGMSSRLLDRLLARGHIIIDPDTREILRAKTKEGAE
jgi:hypothetical protein